MSREMCGFSGAFQRWNCGFQQERRAPDAEVEVSRTGVKMSQVKEIIQKAKTEKPGKWGKTVPFILARFLLIQKVSLKRVSPFLVSAHREGGRRAENRKKEEVDKKMAETTTAPKEKIRFKDIINRNLILIILVQVFSNMSLTMMSSFMNMGAAAAGVGTAAIGTAASIGTVVALISRMPAGALADSQKKKLVVVVILGFRALCFLVVATLGMTGDAGFMAARGVVYGLGWSLVGVVMPAVVAMMMDKRVLGTSWAILSLVQNLPREMVRALGTSLYQSAGVLTATLVAISFSVIAIVLVLFLNFNDPRVKIPAPKEKKSMFKSMHWQYVPLCLVLSLAVFSWTVGQNYNNVLAQERGIDITSILVVTGLISSVASFVLSALCDIIHPKYVLVTLYICLGVGLIVLGGAYTYNSYLVGMILCTLGYCYSTIINVFLFKSVDKSQMGSIQATNYFSTDILSIIAGVLVGTVLQGVGYEMGYRVMSCSALIGAVVVLLFGTKMMNIGQHKKEEA